MDFGNILDELNSFSDEEIKSCFGSNISIDLITQKYTIMEISEKLENFHKNILISTKKKTVDTDNYFTATYFTKNETEKVIGKKLKGMILWYDTQKHKGLICSKLNGKYKKARFKVNGIEQIRNVHPPHIGDLAKYFLFYDETSNIILAENVNIYGHVSTPSKWISLPNGSIINPKRVLKYGRGNDFELFQKQNGLSEEIKNYGYNKKDFDYIYIKTVQDFLKIYKTTSPLKGDEQVENLDEFMKYIESRIIRKEDIPNIR